MSKDQDLSLIQDSSVMTNTPKKSAQPQEIPILEGDLKKNLADQSTDQSTFSISKPALSAQASNTSTTKAEASTTPTGPTISQTPSTDSVSPTTRSISPNPAPHKSNSTLAKIWHALEFIAVTAFIFTILFFLINFQSYSALFQSKLDQLRGQLNNNPYTQDEQNQLKNASSEGQKPLPIVTNSTAAKKQIPELTLSIAPPDDRVVIPRIGQNVPVIRVPTDLLLRRDWTALEKQIQEALRFGVVHFPGTAMPGDGGNVVITGHSSYFPWDPGRFKDVFALLHQVQVGDKIVVYHEQKKYTYEVYEKKVVKPTQVDVLTQNGEDRLTLITCTPVGTDLNRLVVLAKPV
ncbi:class D sortase [Candidatus Peregrinibacteria bacterium]|nr:class D sortase [Candidatus Peregrinibacteria bacterium]